MRVIETVAEMRTACRQAPRPLGLVPTMGALHEGHRSLAQRARRENATAAATIFVNPTQFGPTEDLSQYPRPRQADLALLEQAGINLVFVPPISEIYPPEFDTWVDVGRSGAMLEGALRPGHFRGVATVVTKLFAVAAPDRAYFGQKDGQQTVVIRRLNRDLNLGVEIVICSTVRAPDGLALSSRNVYLTPEQRRAAPVVYRSLCQTRELWQAGEREAERLRQAGRRVLEQEPQVERIDYFSVADAETLEEAVGPITGRVMASVAVKLGLPRLIDNIILE